MKGVIFTEFLEMVEDKFSPEIADRMIEASNLSTGGAYTSVGTYPHSELVEMVGHLSEESEIDVVPLIKVFGQHLFGRFVELYPEFFGNVDSCFGFLALIEDHVHVEVRKLYPDAELPTFGTEQPEPLVLEMTYQSTRPFAPVAEGLIRGCIEHFQEDITLTSENLSGVENTHVRFRLEKTAA
ncbi:heme NO-binding domain-containing protein [Leucothrix mucor]|uniref:heme NO-binding domain-containing protein n=1 Tax=Leucothrix mucor TaxID=45248 RepID=UPI0003B3C836|nr:heme NO-binding domain-containing protein [Leucothrix mucor]